MEWIPEDFSEKMKVQKVNKEAAACFARAGVGRAKMSTKYRDFPRLDDGDGIRIASFEAAYGRVGYIALVDGICDICGEKKTLIWLDSSEAEYGGGGICQKCCEKVWHTIEDLGD